MDFGVRMDSFFLSQLVDPGQGASGPWKKWGLTPAPQFLI